MTRIALVIGNASYRFARPLKNTHADAAAIAATLSSLGFRSSSLGADEAGVTPYLDQSLAEMGRLFADFNRAARTAEMAIVYFSGHGIEIDFNNYLIPVEAELTDVIDVDYKTFSLQRAITAVAGASQLRLIILDACRDNPFSHAMKGLDQGKSLETGLAAPKDTRGAMVFFAAEEGHKAREGKDGALSPFAKALVARLPQQDTGILDVLSEVTEDVRLATNNDQCPRVYGEIKQVKLISKPPTAPEQSPPPVILTSKPENDGNENGGQTGVRSRDSEEDNKKAVTPRTQPSFGWLVLVLGVAVSASIWLYFGFGRPSVPPWKDYRVYLHTSRPDADVRRVRNELSNAGFSLAGVDRDVDQPGNHSPQTAVDYATSTNSNGNAAAAGAVADIVRQVLDVEIRARPQSRAPDRSLGVWLPGKPNYKIVVRFAGSFNRDADIAPMMQKLRDAGWNAVGPGIAGGSDRTSDANGLREIRYTAAEDRPWAQVLAGDVAKTGIVPAMKAVQVSGVTPGNLQVWISP